MKRHPLKKIFAGKKKKSEKLLENDHQKVINLNLCLTNKPHGINCRADVYWQWTFSKYGHAFAGETAHQSPLMLVGFGLISQVF